MSQFDVIIIGSGAGGAPIANKLVKAGKSVLVLEKGPMIDAQPQPGVGQSGFKRDELLADGPEKKLNIPGVSNNGAGYYHSHVEPDINDEPHIYLNKNGGDTATIEGYTAQVVGGGTQLYGGVSLRFTENDLRLKSFNESRVIQNDDNDDVKREARDWAISYAQLEPYYVEAESKVGINGTSANQQKPFSQDVYHPPLNPNPISQFAFNGMVTLGQQLGTNIQPYRPPLAVITQNHPASGRIMPADPESAKTSYVNRFGDPLGLKSNTWVSLLRPIKDDSNFEIRCNCTVTRLKASADQVNEVFYLDPAGIERSATSTLVVVACSAIESIRLLMLSADADSNFSQRIHQNDLLGKYFLTHCFGGASGIVPERFDKSKALDADWATDTCAVTSFLDSQGLWAGAAIYNNTSDQALPVSLFRTLGAQDLDTLWNGFTGNAGLRGDNLINYLDGNFGRGLSVSFMANQVPQFTNRIELHPSVKDKWGRPVAYIKKDWHQHDRYLMDVMAQQCTQVLRNGLGNGAPVSGGSIYMADNALARMANHILGGARFGTDPNDSVLDPNCRAWHFDNLYVTDGSFMPTSGGANPTLTIQANAFRVADHLLGRL
ncbi:MAG: FAD-dependent oxidoreductase [Kangiellaceae bacterium]|nr:FAD-dependent oxidoreductase [Kangiellaceae bacterium]|tara:strand:- start:876 stop:2687 length:1812 start_codon:yes stop_codon:yes gene_type:complete